MPSALLALEDGSLFYGESVGVPGQAVGEVVFNTAMTGYQEILTDPSYARQIVTLTYPHIGNTGANPEDMESPAAGERLARYLQGREDIPADYRLSVARLLEDITASYQGGWYSVISISGGGSPEATRLEIMRKYDIDERKSLAEKISGA